MTITPNARIVGVDIGTNNGYGVLDDDTGERVESGTLRLSLRAATKKRPADHPALRWMGMWNGMFDIFTRHRPRLAVYERVPRHAGTTAAHVHGALLAMLEVAAYQAGVPLLSYTSTEWALAITGQGRSKKEVYVPAINKRFGLELDVELHEDEAAALGLAAVAFDRRETQR